MHTKTDNIEDFSSIFTNLVRQVDKFGVWLDRRVHGFRPNMVGRKFVPPDMFFLLIHSGTTHILYDEQEVCLRPNNFACVLPGHLIKILDASDDIVFSRLIISHSVLQEMKTHALSHDAEKFHYQPVATFNEEQLHRIAALGEIFSAILNHTNIDLPLQRRMLLSQLAVAYEFINYYRREQDKQWNENKYSLLFNRFCDLVVAHYQESREMKYYADLLNLTPKHFSKVIHEKAGISPSEWIDQYVITQAKQLIDTRPNYTSQQIAYALGFSESAAFHHFFKRITGLTPKEYRLQGKNDFQTNF